MSLSIYYLTRDKVDTQKWDHCINTCSNGLVYSYTYYLDAMCSNWSALVLNDYQAVMPLPWRKKWSIYYLYQPPFIAQLGLFANNITADLLEAFLKAIPKKFSYLDYMLNHKNVYPIPLFAIYERKKLCFKLKPTI